MQDDEIPTSAKAKRRLVVLAPGFSGASPTLWEPLLHRLQEEDGYRTDECQLYAFDHKTKRWGTGSLQGLARRLRAEIEAQWAREDGFSDIVLVGHSMGGPVVREAYVSAAGDGLLESGWPSKVSRIVLLASINRGIIPTGVSMRIAAWAARALRFMPHFVARDVLRGSTFLTNLRINWIRLFGLLEDHRQRGNTTSDGTAIRPPLVFQVTGTEDSVVKAADSEDVLCFSKAQHISIPGADHRTVFRIDQADDSNGCYALIRKAFMGGVPPVAKEPDTITHVVFLLHDIRASQIDDWIRELGKKIGGLSETVLIQQPDYGYVSAARFALPSVRRKYIRVFQDWYTEALAKHPRAAFSVVAHSNGSYILGQSISMIPGMRFENVVLAGSVLPDTFNWDALMARGQVLRVRNDRADRDWPVALLCNGLRAWRMRDIGVGGFSGFIGRGVQEVAYHRGGHSVALAPANHESLANFVMQGGSRTTADLHSSPGYFRSMSRLMPYVAWCLLAGLVAGAAYLMATGQSAGLMIGAVVAAATYVILDVI